MHELDIPADRGYEAEDLLTGQRFLWQGPRNYVELNPQRLPAHILRIRRRPASRRTSNTSSDTRIGESRHFSPKLRSANRQPRQPGVAVTCAQYAPG